MKEQLISFETAKLAKEKGFPKDLIIIDHVTDVGSFVEFPTQSLLQKYLREEHKINVWVFPRLIRDGYICAIEKIKDKGKSKTILTISFNTYEEALEHGLFEALKLI